MKSDKQKQFINNLLQVAAIVAVICVIILLFFRTSIFTGALKRFMSILTPFINGFVIAYLLNPLCAFFERGLQKLTAGWKHRPGKGTIRMAGILLSLLCAAIVLILLIIAVLPSLVTSISSLISQIPGAVSRFEAWLTTLDQGETTHEIISYLQQITDTLVNKLQNFLQTSFLPNLQTYVTNVTSSFMNLFSVIKDFGLGCIVAAYLMGDKERFIAQVRLITYALLPARAADWCVSEIRLAHSKFSGFIRGKLLDSLIIGILCYIFMLLARMPYALLVSVIVGVTNIIPFFGPYIGAVPSAVLILTVSPFKCLVFIVFIILLQQFDGNILGPSILGDRLGISGIWILFSILLFSSLWGFAGMIVGVPVFAVLYDLIQRGIYYLLRRKDNTSMIAEYEQDFPKETAKKTSPGKSGRGFGRLRKKK